MDPQGGLRLTGKLGAWGIGTMSMNDEAPGQELSAEDPFAGDAANINIFLLKKSEFMFQEEPQVIQVPF